MFDIVEYVKARCHKKNQNWLAVITGGTGSGKSWSGISMAEAIDPNFSVKNIVFNPLDFVRLIRQPDLAKGSAVVFDEAGVGMPAREWYSVSNRIIGKLLQTFRYKNLAVIFTTPSLSYIDVQARLLFHAFFETTRINRHDGIATLKMKIPQENATKTKIYFKYPRFMNQKVMEIHISKPTTKLVNAYEKHKELYNFNLGNQLEKELSNEDVKPEKEYKSMIDLKKEVKQNLKEDEKITIPRIQSIIPNLSIHKAATIRLELLEERKNNETLSNE